MVWELVRRSASLDTNSAYAYLLLCTDFADTGAVAIADQELVGFVLGYRPPSRRESLFVWQVGVREDCRGLGVASALIADVLQRQAPHGVRVLEATVTPSNVASRSLFRRIAEAIGAACVEVPAFEESLFPSVASPDGESHEEEVRLLIGPFESRSLRSRRLQGWHHLEV